MKRGRDLPTTRCQSRTVRKACHSVKVSSSFSIAFDPRSGIPVTMGRIGTFPRAIFQVATMRCGVCSTIFFVLLALLAGIGSPTKGEDTAAPEFSWEFQKKGQDRRVEQKVTPDAAIFSVQDPSGIGSADVKLSAGRWPQKVVVRLEQFSSLEGFSAQANEIALHAFLPRDDKIGVTFFDEKGMRTDDSAKAAWRLHIRKINEPKAIEIELPVEFLPTNGKAVRLGWVDAYRN